MTTRIEEADGDYFVSDQFQTLMDIHGPLL